MANDLPTLLQRIDAALAKGWATVDQGRRFLKVNALEPRWRREDRERRLRDERRESRRNIAG